MIADVNDIVVIGSQAVLGEFPDAPAEMLVSNEADVFPRQNPGRSELIDATIGEGSPFQRSFGYYAHGVDETTAILPHGWRDRLVLVSGENTRFEVGAWRFMTWRSRSMPPDVKRTFRSQRRSPGMPWLAAKCSNRGWRRPPPILKSEA
jgi:hypothetical protein